jgi:hypothetical protein
MRRSGTLSIEAFYPDQDDGCVRRTAALVCRTLPTISPQFRMAIAGAPMGTDPEQLMREPALALFEPWT